MLGTGLGFGELGGVRIVVMEKRTFTGEMGPEPSISIIVSSYLNKNHS